MRIAWFDCSSGISGDMTLAALVGAGWPVPELESLPRRLRLDGVSIVVSDVRRGGFAARRVEVRVEAAKQPHRHLHHVAALIEAGELAAPVREEALAVFRRLAEAEAEVHGTSVEKVHFHEVGAVDAIVDVVGAVEGMAALGVEKIYATPPRLGRGTVPSEHGVIPVPAPATALLLRGVPVEPGGPEAELTTPTGAALLTTWVKDWSSPPRLRTVAIGVGAGSRELVGQANVLRLTLGDVEGASLTRRTVAVLETALDDENPQYVAALIPGLLAAGALDAMVVPSVMKKGRAGLWLVVVAEPAAAGALAERVLRETASLGVRVRMDERWELPRRLAEASTPYGPITLKVATLPDGGERAMPEFESVRSAAERSGRTLREVSEAALAAWRERGGAKP